MVALSLFAVGCGNTARHTAMFSPNLAIFGTPSNADEMVPEQISTMLTRQSTPEFTIANINQARRVRANEPAWLVPASNGELCLARLLYPLLRSAYPPLALLTCLPEAAVQSGHLVTTQALMTSGIHARLTRVTGVVPDGVATVSIVARHARPTTSPVIRNAYEAVVSRPISVRFITRANNNAQRHSVPLVTFSATNVSPAPTG